MFQVTQLERSKRSGKTKLNFNNAIELKKYSGKHALNGILICKDCKAEYRRAVWTKRDKTRQAVWRCSSRLDYGRKYCENSITIDEVSLKSAILESINSTKKDRQKLIDIFTSELGKTMRDMSNMDTVNILEIEAKIATLTAETMKIISNPENITKMHLYKDELKIKSDEIKRLKAIIQKQQENKVSDKIEERIADITSTMEEDEYVNSWNESLVRQLIRLIEVVDEDTIHITYTNGYEHDQNINLQVRKLYKVG